MFRLVCIRYEDDGSFTLVGTIKKDIQILTKEHDEAKS